MDAVTVVVGVATWYAGIYVGESLYCGGVYADTTTDWIALSIEDPMWKCGDLAVLWFEGEGAADHEVLVARVMDTGPFGKHCVLQVDGSCVPIRADVPAHLWPRGSDLSAPVRVVNVTAECRKRGLCD